jgi:hypothetical protein
MEGGDGKNVFTILCRNVTPNQKRKEIPNGQTNVDRRLSGEKNGKTALGAIRRGSLRLFDQ